MSDNRPMRDADSKILPPRGLILTQRVERGLGAFIFVTAFLCILFATTFPFDFSISPAASALQKIRDNFDWHWTQYDPHYTDRIENVLLFMPLGFGIASLFSQRRKFRVAWQIAAVFLLSCLLSTTVEISQNFISFRDPSLMDIRSNTTGGTLGAIVFVLIGELLLRAAARGLLLLRLLAKPAIIGSALAIYGLSQLSMPMIMHNPRDLSNWEPGMSLSIGNRLSGDRAWSGKVSRVILADRAADADEVKQIADGAETKSIFADSLLADYQLNGLAPFQDVSGQSPPLLWKNQPAWFISDKYVNTDAQHWLRTAAPVTPATDRIAKSWQLSVVVNCATDNLHQYGPARVFSISNRTNGLNLELGQEGPQLALRLCTAVPSTPDMRLASVFTDTSPHQIIVTVKEARIIFYIDGQERGVLEITPEAKVIWRLYPRGFAIWVGRYGFRVYAAIYRLLVFIPFSALLGAMIATSNWSRKTKRIVALAVIVVMALALEIILGTQAASGFQIKNLTISLIAAFGILGGMKLITARLRA